jgi:polyphosphate glucokinase
MVVLGIDVGGTGIKGATVDTSVGALTSPRHRVLTPKPASPNAIAETVASLVDHFSWSGPVGCGFPAVICHGEVMTAANISKHWLGLNAAVEFETAAPCKFTVANDADVAGLAEMRFGAGKDRNGVVLFVTLGTGIGSALFIDGKLIPNTELGHIEINGREAEAWAAESVREKKDLSWKKWARRVDTYLKRMHAYLWPDLIIVGGGVSKKHDKFLPYLTVDAEVVPAMMRNEAGIIGAALLASETQ